MEVGGVSRPAIADRESGVESALFWVLCARILGALLRGVQRQPEVCAVVTANKTRRIHGRAAGDVKTRGRFEGVRVLGNRRAERRKVHLPSSSGVQSTRGVRLRRWRPHSRKVPLEVELAGDKALPRARRAWLSSSVSLPGLPRTGPRSPSRRDDLARFHTRQIRRF